MAYERVLVATDFSENAAFAARWGLKLASDEGVVRVLSVLAFPEPPAYLRGPQRDELLALSNERRADARETLVEWARHAGVPKPDAVVREGPPAREIAREAIDFGADLVVMGARGMTPMQRLLLGSTTRSVLRHVPSDVLVVRGETQGAPIVQRILVATDFYAPSKAAARRASKLALLTGAELIAYHAIDPNVYTGVMRGEPRGEGLDSTWIEKATGDMLHQFNVETMGGKAKEVLGHGRAAADIAGFARSVGADLVVLGTHGAGLLARALLGSVAEAVVEEAPCTVLVAHP